MLRCIRFAPSWFALLTAPASLGCSGSPAAAGTADLAQAASPQMQLAAGDSRLTLESFDDATLAPRTRLRLRGQQRPNTQLAWWYYRLPGQPSRALPSMFTVTSSGGATATLHWTGVEGAFDAALNVTIADGGRPCVGALDEQLTLTRAAGAPLAVDLFYAFSPDTFCPGVLAPGGHVRTIRERGEPVVRTGIAGVSQAFIELRAPGASNFSASSDMFDTEFILQQGLTGDLLNKPNAGSHVAWQWRSVTIAPGTPATASASAFFVDTPLPPRPIGPVLTNGDLRPDLAGTEGQSRFFELDVPAGARDLRLELSGAGNADLFVRRGARPTPTDHDFASTFSGSTERVHVPTPAPGKYHVLVHGRRAYSGTSLSAFFAAP